MLKTIAFGALLVALFTSVLVVRHTRAEEDSGRLELMSAAVLGRYAPLAAALAVAVGASVVLGGVTAVALIATGLPVAGSVAFGLTWACAGTAFAAVAAVAAQLTDRARTATGSAVAVLGCAYLLRAIGDSAGGATWVSWLSPIGWAQQIRPYGGNRWVVAALPLTFAAVLVGVAVLLTDRRDLGAGLLPARPGAASAAPGLRRSPSSVRSWAASPPTSGASWTTPSPTS